MTALDEASKRRQVERALRGMDKMRSLEERKEIARRAKERKAARQERGRERRDWRHLDEDDDAPPEFERIRGHGGGALSRPGSTAPSLPDAAFAWLVVGLGPRQVTVAKGEKRRPAHLGGAPLPGGPPAVGDRVALTELAGGEARVRALAPRRTWLARRDPGNPHASKVLAANVDVALLCVDHGPRGLRRGLLDRMRLAVDAGGIEPLVVVTKVDALDAEGRAFVEGVLEELAQEELVGFATSATSGEGVDALARTLHGKVAVALGHSGVGKSTLLNALDPEHERRTGEVRVDDGRGRHTTTASAMHPLPTGGWLVDTPGIREFGVVGLDAEEVLAGFPELARLAGGCPRGCVHAPTDVEHCAILRSAAEDPRVAGAHARYRRIVESG